MLIPIFVSLFVFLFDKALELRIGANESRRYLNYEGQADVVKSSTSHPGGNQVDGLPPAPSYDNF